MKKRDAFLAFLIFFSIILMPNALSIYGESVYSGTVKDRDAVNISGMPFEFRIESVSKKVYVSVNDSALIIPGGDCKIKGSFNICIGNISFSHTNHTTFIDVYTAVVNIYVVKSKIAVTNTIRTENLLIGEETSAELAIENKADIVAKEVLAAINVPPNLLVISAEGCKNSYDYIIFEDDVYPRQIKKCIFKLRGISGGNFELTANTTFFDGTAKVSAAPSAISGKVYNHSLKITRQENKSRMGMGETINFTIGIENINDKYSLDVTSFNIKIPDSILLITRPKGTTGNNKLISWSGTLAPNEKKSFVAEVQGNIPGNYSVLVESSYKISNFLRAANSMFNLEVYCDCPYITHDFSGQIVAPNQKTWLTISIVNPSSTYNFKDIKLNYFTNIPSMQDLPTSYAKISPLETIKIFDSSITGPDLGEVYHLNITAAYKSPENKFFYVKDKIIIKAAEIKAPEKEVKNETKENNETESKQDVKQDVKQESKEISLNQEKTNISINESGKKEIKEEIPATTIKPSWWRQIKVFSIFTYATILAFILIVLVIFNKRRNRRKDMWQDNSENKDQAKPGIEPKPKPRIEPKIEPANYGDSGIKEFFSLIFRRKKKVLEKPSKPGKNDLEYEFLEKEINKLGGILEKGKK